MKKLYGILVIQAMHFKSRPQIGGNFVRVSIMC